MSGKKRTRRGWLDRYSALLVGVVLVGAWQILVPLSGLSEFVLPTPLAIGKRIVSDASLLMAHTYVTLLEVVFGFAIGVLMGVPLALFIFYSKAFERAIYPILVGLQTVPKISLAPILVLYLGYGWAPKIVLAFLISFFPIVISTVVGLQSLDKNLVNLVRSMGANEWQTFFKLRLPAALPNIFGGFKVAVSLAVIGAVIGEYVAAERGLGYLQLQANSQFDTTLNFATVVTISALGVILYFIIDVIEARVSYKRDAGK
ncbi:ABC transporter permease [Bradyrhizobium manausense]|uniref:ABC transporter permease n=1 Tax=Bradyrhizobium manausense TaxID=989370 RepID=UPI001BAACAF2|nr:ABC transporter permease [Bradyrhizobium manausense]MBR0725008.1 ABC transporter permease [Bradyrhizobium manausense]MBR0836939.1 ABC transporter permease [Bradyrhizobium manausense]